MSKKTCILEIHDRISMRTAQARAVTSTLVADDHFTIMSDENNSLLI